jgi:N-acetyl-gamma-glutamyl-phosphate reductase
MKKLKAVIIGASGYTGADLIRILLNHPNVEIKSLLADSNAGKELAESYPHLANLGLPKLIKFEQENFKNVDVAFMCLPHGTTQQVALQIPSHVKIIDISADFRLNNLDEYAKWYGHKHQAPKLQKNAVYALTEINRDKIKKAGVIACPGCYPTSILLPLLPLIKKGLIKKTGIIADSKSGISGAGRKAVVDNLFTEINENLKPYGIANHRHVSEIEQELSIAAKSPVQITFTPQVVPINRGMLSVIYVENEKGVEAEKLKAELQKKYKDEKFVKIADGAYVPTIRDVASTNNALINVFADRVKGRSIIISAIDNLTKGASGQAVQNFNIAFNLPEDAGLNFTPVFP